MANRVSQEAVEVLDQSSTRKARVSQAAVEVLDQPSTQRACISQVAVEVLRLNGTGGGGATIPAVFGARWVG